jgi:hypothetical protein
MEQMEFLRGGFGVLLSIHFMAAFWVMISLSEFAAVFLDYFMNPLFSVLVILCQVDPVQIILKNSCIDNFRYCGGSAICNFIIHIVSLLRIASPAAIIFRILFKHCVNTS